MTAYREHQIIVQADSDWTIALVCSCSGYTEDLLTVGASTDLWDLVRVAQKHVDDEVVGTSQRTFVPAPEYVHGLDPVDDDPRRVMP